MTDHIEESNQFFREHLTTANARIAELERERAGLAKRIGKIPMPNIPKGRDASGYYCGFAEALQAAAQLADAKGEGE